MINTIAPYKYLTIERYELLSSQIYNAIISNDKNRMSYFYEKYKTIADASMLEHKRNVAENIIRNNGGVPYVTRLPLDMLDIDSARANAIGAYFSVEEVLKVEYAKQERYNFANKVMFESSTPFTPNQVLFKEEQKEFTVSDMLEVSKYAIKVAQMLQPSNDNFEKANAAITVFQGIEHALNNQADNGSPRRMLHLANEVLTSVVKSQAKTDEQKGIIIGISLLIDSAINFLCKK